MSVNDSVCFALTWTQKNGGKKQGWEDVPCSRETTQVCNIAWPTRAFSYNQYAKSITFIPEDLRVTGLRRTESLQRAAKGLSFTLRISSYKHEFMLNKRICQYRQQAFLGGMKFSLLYILDSCLLNICRNLTRRLQVTAILWVFPRPRR